MEGNRVNCIQFESDDEGATKQKELMIQMINKMDARDGAMLVILEPIDAGGPLAVKAKSIKILKDTMMPALLGILADEYKLIVNYLNGLGKGGKNGD